MEATAKKEAALSKMKQTISMQNTNVIIEMLKKLMCDQRNEADFIIVQLLDELEKRMPEDEFCVLCDTI